MTKYLFAALLLLWTPVTALAGECDSGNPSVVIASGAPFGAVWVQAPTQTAPDGSTIPARIDGFIVQIDSGLRMSITAASLGTCPAGTTYAGYLRYSYRTTSGVPKGTHTLRISAWNYFQDCSSGTCINTATVQESAVVAVPFVVDDPLVSTGPPSAPVNVQIIK